MSAWKRVLVLNGGADPIVPVAQVEPFKKEMAAAGVDAEVVLYPGVKHSYANPYADHAGSDAMAYDAKAHSDSWSRLLKLLASVYR
jgi:dienelactone hydrolase